LREKDGNFELNFSEWILNSLDFGTKVNEKVEAFTNTLVDISKSVLETINNFPWQGLFHAYYMMKLYQAEYPPCIHLSEDELSQIDNLIPNLQKNTTVSTEIMQKVEEIIFSSYSTDKLNEMLSEWEDFIDNKDRLPALREAIDAYNSQKYYSCTAIIVTNVGGIISENEKALEALLISPESDDVQQRIKELLEKQEEAFFDNNKNDKPFNKNTEKLSAERQLALNWNYVTMLFQQYFSNYFYHSDLSKSKRRNHPNRHKICHGADTNYGTQRKALKSILCLDALIRFVHINNDENVRA